MAWGRTVGGAVMAVVVTATASCGMIADERAGSARQPSVSEETTVGTAVDVSIPTTTVLTLAEPEPGVVPPAQDTVPPALLTEEEVAAGEASLAETLNPEDLAAIDRCRRVHGLQLAGTRVVQGAVDEPSAVPALVQEVVTALQQLESVVAPENVATLTAVLDQIRAVADQFDVESFDVVIADLQAMLQRLGPQFTELVSSLQPLCPSALGTDTLNQAEQIQFGKPTV